jgi:hypothetical protein
MTRFLYVACCALIVLLCCAPLLQAGDCRGVLQIQQVQADYGYQQQVQFVQQPQYVQRVQVQRVYQPQVQFVQGYQQQFRQRQFVRQPVVFQQRFRQSRFRQPLFLNQGVGGTTIIRERSIGPFGLFGRSRTVIQQ